MAHQHFARFHAAGHEISHWFAAHYRRASVLGSNDPFPLERLGEIGLAESVCSIRQQGLSTGTRFPVPARVRAITEYPVATPEVPVPSVGPLVLGSDGNLCSANGGFTGGSTLGRFNTTTHRVDYFHLPRPAAGPCDIDPVAAAGGKLVVGQTTGGAVAVARIDDLNAMKP